MRNYKSTVLTYLCNDDDEVTKLFIFFFIETQQKKKKCVYNATFKFDLKRSRKFQLRKVVMVSSCVNNLKLDERNRHYSFY